MSKISALGCACVLIVVPVTARAREFYYFNKAGVSRDAYVRERVECQRLAGAVDLPKTQAYMPYNPNLTGVQNGAAQGIAMGLISIFEGARERRMMMSVERTCMADKGYGRYVVDKDVIVSIAKLKDEESKLDRFFELAALATPVGKRSSE